MKGKDKMTKVLRFLPWLARATVYANPRHEEWSIERFNAEAGKVMRDFLTQKGEIN